MAEQIVTVFGGTGFLGRRIVRHLRDQGFAVRIASRHAQQAGEGTGGQSIRADINNEASVTAAVAGAYAVVNAVSLYRERGSETFNAVHVKAAERLARQSHQAGVERLVHVSGIGADAQSKSSYIRSRGEGELAVQNAFPKVAVVRPAVMFGPDNAFLTTLVTLLKRLPVYPMFGRGTARLQPVHVEDVAEAIVRTLQPTAPQPVAYELGGPRVYVYEDLLKVVAAGCINAGSCYRWVFRSGTFWRRSLRWCPAHRSAVARWNSWKRTPSFRPGCLVSTRSASARNRSSLCSRRSSPGASKGWAALGAQIARAAKRPNLLLTTAR